MNITNEITKVSLQFTLEEFEQSKFLRELAERCIEKTNYLSEVPTLKVSSTTTPDITLYRNHTVTNSSKTSEISNFDKENLDDNKVTDRIVDTVDNYVRNSRLPNSLENINNKYKKEIVDEHMSDKNCQIVDMSQLKEDKIVKVSCNEFQCPDCHQSSFIVVDNEQSDKLNYVVSIKDKEDTVLVDLDRDMIKELLTANDMSFVDLYTGVDDKNKFIEIIFEALKMDSSYMKDRVVIEYTTEPIEGHCPLCGYQDHIAAWHNAARTGGDLDYTPCKYCGSECLIDYKNDDGYVCDNKNCYSHKLKENE